MKGEYASAARRELALMPRGARPRSDMTLVVPGVVASVDTTGQRVVVSIDGGEPVALRAVAMLGGTLADVYLVGRTVSVLRNPWTGRAEQVLGPVIPPSVTPTDADSVPSAGPSAPTSNTFTVTVTPSWSGTWRDDRGAYDRWNTDRYGGRSTLYQGDAYGSGDLVGLAVYGDKIKGLGATTITDMRLTLIGAGLDLTSWPAVTVQPATNGSKPAGAPSTAGSTVNGSPGKSGTVHVTIPSGTYASFADGTYRGLALVGANYNAVRGTSSASAMALRITYTRPT